MYIFLPSPRCTGFPRSGVIETNPVFTPPDSRGPGPVRVFRT